jgi:hypothetical protein
MKSHIASIGGALAIVAGLGVNGVFAQQAPVAVTATYRTESRITES